MAGLSSFAMGISRNSNGTFAPGNISNPAGTNQWSRRREVEQLWLQLLGEVNVEQGRSRIEVILDRLVTEAEAGRSWAPTIAGTIPLGTYRIPTIRASSRRFSSTDLIRAGAPSVLDSNSEIADEILFVRRRRE